MTDWRTDRRMDASPRTAVVFFSSYKLPKTVPVTTLPLFGHVTLLCGKCIYFKLSEGPVQLSDCTIGTPPLRATSLSIHTDPVRQQYGTDTTSKADQHLSEISPLTASETFTQRRMRRIGAGSPHAHSSVNGASERQVCLKKA